MVFNQPFYKTLKFAAPEIFAEHPLFFLLGIGIIFRVIKQTNKMDIIVKEAVGLPDKAYVSIRIGETRRQGKFYIYILYFFFLYLF